MGRLIEEVRGEGSIRVANESNAVLLTGTPEDYYHEGTMDISPSDRMKEDQYQRTPRSCYERDGLLDQTSNIQAGNIVLYVSLFSNKVNQVENIVEIDDGASIDETMSNDDDGLSEYGNDDYGDLTNSCHEDEEFPESWSSIFSSESNNDAQKSVSLLHYIPKKSVSDSNISPVNIPYDGSLKPDTLATDSLLSSLNKDMRTAKLHKQKTSAKGLGMSNFTRALKVLKMSINRTSYSVLSHPTDLCPRMTDDAVPGLSCHEREDDALLEGSQTHECAPGDSMHPPLELPRGNEFRGRDSRMNSLFLRLYAIDYLARCSGTLPSSYSSRELSYVIHRSRATRLFHRRYNIISVSNISRDKLWDNVMLPPRSDDTPCAYIDSSNYVYVGDDSKNEAAEVRSHYTKPAGVMSNSRCFYNDQSPQAGNTNLQYTVKGWCNSRWLDCSNQ